MDPSRHLYTLLNLNPAMLFLRLGKLLLIKRTCRQAQSYLVSWSR